jgi:ribosomal protein S18 acetylase RimI-like enzyme
MIASTNPDKQLAPSLRIRPLDDNERAWLEEQLTRSWGSSKIVNRGYAHNAAQLPAFVCLAQEDVLGVATFHIHNEECELVTLNALRQGRGVGTALLEAVVKEATLQGCQRVWLVTTNDNLSALRFYQRRDMRLVAIHRGAVDLARTIKSSIPLIGHYGIQVHDELELELSLQ